MDSKTISIPLDTRGLKVPAGHELEKVGREESNTPEGNVNYTRGCRKPVSPPGLNSTLCTGIFPFPGRHFHRNRTSTTACGSIGNTTEHPVSKTLWPCRMIYLLSRIRPRKTRVKDNVILIDEAVLIVGYSRGCICVGSNTDILPRGCIDEDPLQRPSSCWKQGYRWPFVLSFSRGG